MSGTNAAAILELWFGEAASANDDGAAPGSHRGRSAKASSAPPHPLSKADASIVARIRTGDPDTFDTLFRAYFSRLADFANATVRDEAVAQELAAEVFLSIWRRRGEWAPRHSVAAYLYRAVRNLAQTYIRDRSAELARWRASAYEASALTESVEALDDRDARLNAVWHAVDQLSDIRRTIVHLRWREQMSFEEIAVLLDLSPAAVKMQLSRAFKTVRSLLPDAFEE